MENKDICSVCGGKCCKKSGCDYSPRDFSNLGFNELNKILSEEKISIVSTLSFERLPNNKLFVNPFLYLRARNNNRPVVDLFSTKTTCSQLTNTGCSYNYEQRPFGGKNLIPSLEVCHPEIPQIEIIKEWDRYQKTLSKLVKRLTGNSVDQQLRIDVEKVFYDALTENFDDVTPVEIMDITSMLPILVEIYPQEYVNALEKASGKVKIKKAR